MAESAWDEKEWFDLDSDTSDEFGEEDVPEEPPTSVGKGSHHTEECSLDIDTGTIYPIDVWFLISQYIPPEDTGRFAGICQATLRVVYSAKFWINLYHRYYQEEDSTPVCLKPDYMLKLNGLRSRVVRSMFHFYSPFKASVSCKIPFKQDCSLLHGTTCTLMWHRTSKNFWQFYFKFQKPESTPNLSKLVTNKKLILCPPDVHLNSEEGCCVLEVVTQNFISIPPTIMGQTLRQSCLSVGHGMRYHKLKLVFADIKTPEKSLSSDSGITVTLDPVVNLRVLNWWHPYYPC